MDNASLLTASFVLLMLVAAVLWWRVQRRRVREREQAREAAQALLVAEAQARAAEAKARARDEQQTRRQAAQDAAAAAEKAAAARAAAEQAAAEQAALALARQRSAAEAKAKADAANAAEAAARARSEADAAAAAEREAAAAAADSAATPAPSIPSMPLAPPPPPPPRTLPPHPTPQPPPSPVAQRRPEETLVMVADDSKVVRVKTSRLLQQHRYRVVLAEDGRQAAALIDEEVPLVLITDVEMPGMDGFELTRHVRRHPRAARIAIIMITAADERLKQAAAEAGVTLVLGKPYAEAALLACIEQAQAVAEPAAA